MSALAMFELKTLNPQFENILCPNGKVGLVLLSTDMATLYEFGAIFKNTGILILPARIQSESEITPENLLQMQNKLADTANTIMPDSDLDVVAFSCTSASMTIGEQVVTDTIQQSSQIRKINTVCNPFSAIKYACMHLKINKIGLITPYTAEITFDIIKKLQSVDINIMQAISFNEKADFKVPHISYASIKQAVLQMVQDDVADELEAIFISCTNFHICTYIEELETLTGKKILTSNQVMAWDIFRACCYQKPINHFGELLRTNHGY